MPALNFPESTLGQLRINTMITKHSRLKREVMYFHVINLRIYLCSCNTAAKDYSSRSSSRVVRYISAYGRTPTAIMQRIPPPSIDSNRRRSARQRPETHLRISKACVANRDLPSNGLSSTLPTLPHSVSERKTSQQDHCREKEERHTKAVCQA